MFNIGSVVHSTISQLALLSKDSLLSILQGSTNCVNKINKKRDSPEIKNLRMKKEIKRKRSRAKKYLISVSNAEKSMTEWNQRVSEIIKK